MTDSPPSDSLIARHRRWIGVILVVYWATIFTGTHVPVPPPIGPPDSDKLVHFGAYVGLAFLLGLWIAARRTMQLQHYALVFALLVGYAVADELLQIPVNRTADIKDFTADVLGSLTGLLLLRVALPRLREWTWSKS